MSVHDNDDVMLMSGSMLPRRHVCDEQNVIALAFSKQLIRWQRLYGRKDLAWQNTRVPYRIWLSEIMLQQTQVATVVAYYDRFLQKFPSILDLANASQEAVLAQWSGLGYYSRARNLHRCAQIIRDQYNGVFPCKKADLEQLPGIGPSTAAAISAFCFGERVSIFDANVQRVMARFFAYGKDLSRSANQRELWQRAADLLPQETPVVTLDQRMTAYTQGLMDLGATVCLPRQPNCENCPVAVSCQAYAHNTPQAYPVKTGKLKRTVESWWLLAVVHVSMPGRLSVWLYKRPQKGIWAGLYCLPVFADKQTLLASVKKLHGTSDCTIHPVVKHVLTHKDLLLHPVSVVVNKPIAFLENPTNIWSENWDDLGLPAPVRKWLDAFQAPGISVYTNETETPDNIASKSK